MNKINRFVLYCCLSALLIILNCGMAYAEMSIDTFKQVAGEAEEIRSQYKERQEYLQEKQYLKETVDTIDLYNEELINNSLEQTNVGKNIFEVSQKQQENNAWLKQHKKLIEYRAPQLKTLNEYSERMHYLEKKIADCEKLIAKEERRVEQYNKQIEILMRQAADYDEQAAFGSVSFNEKTQAVLKALAYVEYAEDRLDEANALKIKFLRGDSPTVDNSEQNDKIHAQVEKLEYNAQYYNVQLEKYYKLEQDLHTIKDKIEAEYDLAQEKEDLFRWQEELKNYHNELKNEIKTAESEKIRLEKYLAYERYGKYLSAGMEYYSWKSKDGFSGHQFYLPVSYFQDHGYSEYGVSFGLVNTSADLGADDGLNGITDLSLYYGRRKVYENYEIKYTLNVDLPVGESKTGDIPLSDDLVPVTRLSEGLHIRPGLELLYRDGEENIWRAGIGYTFKGNYDYSKNNPGLSVSPGNALDGFLSWTHAEKDYQFRLGIEPTWNTNKTKGNDFSYTEGIELLFKAMYNRRLTEHSDLMGYYWLRKGFADKYDYPAGDNGNGSAVHYYGLEYKYSPHEQHAWFVRSNNMSSTGKYYDPVSGESIDGRRKHVVGAGYEYTMDNGGKIGVGVNNFWMKDKNPERKYDGVEAVCWFSTSF